MIKTNISLEFDGVLELGYPGENDARGFEFDVSEWMGVFEEGGSLALLAKRPWEPDYYPCVLEVNGTTATWVVGLADVAIPGNNGKVVLQYKIGDTVVRSKVFPTVICEGIGGDQGEVPEPQEPWVQQVLAAGECAAQAAGAAGKFATEAGIAAKQSEAAVETVEKSATEAKTAADRAEKVTTKAEEAAAQAQAEAKNAATEADRAEDAAAQAQAEAKNAATEADRAKTAADRAEKAAERAEDAAKIHLVDAATGAIYVLGVDGGNLYIEEAT